MLCIVTQPSILFLCSQADPSVGVSSPVSMHSTPLFGRISSFQPTMASANPTFPIGTPNAFHGETYGTPGFLERPKKVLIDAGDFDPSIYKWVDLGYKLISKGSNGLMRNVNKGNKSNEQVNRAEC